MNKVDVPAAFNDTARLLEGLGDPTRVRILCLLGCGKMSVAAIAGHFTMTRPAISHHLKVMLDSGLLLNQKSGQEVYYWVDCNKVVTALRGLACTIEGCCTNGKCCVPGNIPEQQERGRA
jgi:ArsR family transcriptional regulator